MSRLRVGSLSNPFSKSESNTPMRPSADRSQSALLPLQTINTDAGSDENGEEVPTSLQSPSSATPTTRRNRAHTVAVALGPPRREGRGRRRSSAASNPRGLEEGRGEREGSPVRFELGNEHEDLNDEVVGMLDVIDPEVSTGMSYCC
jgi:hypothetical protein